MSAQNGFDGSILGGTDSLRQESKSGPLDTSLKKSCETIHYLSFLMNRLPKVVRHIHRQQ
jgi:hypothetical protein